MANAPQTWFITGCSSGFGELFVRKLRAAGDNVIATGRNADTKLAHLKDTGATILDLDMTASPAEIKSKLDQAWNIYPGGIDVVVNNAGFILSGGIEELTQEDMELSLKTNFLGPLNVARAVLPNLRAKGKGTLVFISSVAGWGGAPSAGAYASSKFALEGAVECLAKELALVAPGIKVFMPEPGYFSTSVFSNINHVPARLEDYAQFNAGVSAFEAGLVGNEPGDADKGTQLMIELIKGTGIAEGKELPLRIPIGSDSFSSIKQKCEDMLKLSQEWEHIGKLSDRAN